jgi:predicted esterase YcpF (UPF0227 family)
VIIYFHGLNGSGASAKAAWLRERFAPLPLLAPTYPAHEADKAVAQLRDFLRASRAGNPEDTRLMLVGSSLGGLYAAHLAPEFGAGIVLINPSIKPDETLRRYAGPQHNELTGEDYVLTEKMLRDLSHLRPVRCRTDVPTLLLLDAADEVLDYRIAEAFYRGCGRTLLYPGGSHRFDHLETALPEIRRFHDELA